MLVSEMESELGPEPTEEELAAYRAGLLSRQDAERVKDHLTVHPGILDPPEVAELLAVESAAVWRIVRERLHDGLLGPPLAAAAEKIRSSLRGNGHRREPSLDEARRFVALVVESLDELNRASRIEGESASFIRQSVLQSSSPAFVLRCRGLDDWAADWVIAAWSRMAESFGAARKVSGIGRFQTRYPEIHGLDEAESLELLSTFSTALLESHAGRETALRGREILRRLMVHLRLGARELGRMLRVSPEAVQQWEQGDNIPDRELAEVVVADEALTRLLEMFRPTRLPQVVRRKADLFEGGSALDWILDGRIREVADRYDVALRYQA